MGRDVRLREAACGVQGERVLLAVHRDFGQHRFAWEIIVPQIVMHELEVPLLLAGLQIDGHERFGVEIVPGPVAAVGVDRWRFASNGDRLGHVAHFEFGIDRRDKGRVRPCQR